MGGAGGWAWRGAASSVHELWRRLAGAGRGPRRAGVLATFARVLASSLGLDLGLVVAADGRHALAAMLARGDDALADEEKDGRDEEDGRDDDGDDDREGRGTRASASVVAAVTVSFGHARQSFTS